MFKKSQILLIVFCTVSAGRAQSLAEDLMAHWKCDDNSSSLVVLDSSKYQWDGVASRNTSLFSSGGKFKRAFDMSAANPGDFVTLSRTIFDLGALGKLVRGREVVLADFVHDEHMQDITADGDYVYTSWTDYLVKHDMYGNLAASADLRTRHHGGLCYYNGYLYVCYFSGATKRIKVHEARTLAYVTAYDVSASMTLGDGPGAICYYGGYFYVADVVTGEKADDLRIYKYDTDFVYQADYVVYEDFDAYGAQTIEHFQDKFILGTYKAPDYRFVVCDNNFVAEANYRLPSIAEGIVRVNDDTFMVSQSVKDGGYYTGSFRRYNRITYSAPEQAFSMCFWLNCAYLPSELADPPGSSMTIFGIAGRYPCRAVYSQTYSKLYWYLYTVGEGGVSPAPSVAETSGYLLRDTWMHLVFVYSGATAKIYIDGVERASVNRTGDMVWTSGDWFISSDLSTRLCGAIDDIRMYAKALSGEEVLGLYADVLGPYEEVPEAEVYHVDKFGGSDLNDGLTMATAFATIQRGIDSSVDGGEVLVWPGVYSQAINFLGKAITVRSAGDAATIEAPGQDAVTFHSGEGAESVLKNFVIRNSGLGISANYGSSPTISNLTIVDNDFGVAAYEDSNPDISNCILWDNRDGDLWGCQARYSLVEQEIETGPVDGLISHWRFDEGRGTTAGDSAGDNDGAISGAQWVVGQLSGALSFDGADDYVNIPDAGVFDFNDGDVSISMWFKTSVYANQTLMKLRQYDDDPHLEIYNSTTYGNVGTRAMPTGEAGAIVAYNAGRVDNGNWHYVAVSVENGAPGGYKLYLDGALVGMNTFSGGLMDWNAIAIGNDASGGGYFNGSIDDVRVYDRALSAGEVELLYDGGLTGRDDTGNPQPLFANAEAGDYHLLSEHGRYWPEHHVWVLDKVSSLCIDAGDPAIEPVREPMPNGGAINIGAFGGTEYASMSKWAISSDYDRNGRTDFRDFAVFCDEWLMVLPWAQQRSTSTKYDRRWQSGGDE